MDIPTLNILAIGRDSDILEVVQRLINSHEHWVATIVTTDEEAIAAFMRQRHPIVFELDPSVTVIRHFGGGSGLLENEVRTILDRKGIYIINA
jgi:hypothetical protein